jgi:undecaprenyl-diphosphatase
MLHNDRDSSSAGLLAFGAACVALFALIAWNVFHGVALPRLDLAAAGWFHRHARPGLTDFFLVLTDVHSVEGMSVAGVLLGAGFYRLGARRWLSFTAVVVPGGMLLNVLLKYAFTRARPVFADPIRVLSTYSFPSGHTAATTVFYGIVVAWLCRADGGPSAPARRAGWICAGLLMIALVGLSRIYLGVHFLSDVLAAQAESGAWLALCFAVLRPGAFPLSANRSAL